MAVLKSKKKSCKKLIFKKKHQLFFNFKYKKYNKNNKYKKIMKIFKSTVLNNF